MNAAEQHWMDRGGILLHQFLVMGYDTEQHVAALTITCGDDKYCNDAVRHAIEGTACQAFRERYGMPSHTGVWSDYVLPYVDEYDDIEGDEL